MVALLRQLFENILFIIHHIDKIPHLFSTCRLLLEEEEEEEEDDDDDDDDGENRGLADFRIYR